jgi:hypothetical protein
MSHAKRWAGYGIATSGYAENEEFQSERPDFDITVAVAGMAVAPDSRSHLERIMRICQRI